MDNKNDFIHKQQSNISFSSNIDIYFLIRTAQKGIFKNKSFIEINTFKKYKFIYKAMFVDYHTPPSSPPFLNFFNNTFLVHVGI